MWGKKVRVYYHGIPFFCVNCYEIGHNRNDCPNKTISWKDNINYLVSTGINSELFGTWIDSNVSTTRESQSDVPQPFFETPKNTEKNQSADEDSDSDIDFANLPPKVVSLLKKLSSTPKSTSKSVNSDKKKSDAKFKAKTRQQDYFRGRGRGRGGRGRGNESTRGRGSQSRGRGRGRA